MARGQNSHTWTKNEKVEGVVSSAVCRKCQVETRKVMGAGKRRANVVIAQFRRPGEETWSTDRILCFPVTATAVEATVTAPSETTALADLSLNAVPNSDA